MGHSAVQWYYLYSQSKTSDYPSDQFANKPRSLTS